MARTGLRCAILKNHHLNPIFLHRTFQKERYGLHLLSNVITAGKARPQTPTNETFTPRPALSLSLSNCFDLVTEWLKQHFFNAKCLWLWHQNLERQLFASSLPVSVHAATANQKAFRLNPIFLHRTFQKERYGLHLLSNVMSSQPGKHNRRHQQMKHLHPAPLSLSLSL